MHFNVKTPCHVIVGIPNFKTPYKKIPAMWIWYCSHFEVLSLWLNNFWRHQKNFNDLCSTSIFQIFYKNILSYIFFNKNIFTFPKLKIKLKMCDFKEHNPYWTFIFFSLFFNNIVMLQCSVIYWIIIPKRNRNLRTWIGDNCFLKLSIIECWGWQSQGYHNVWHPWQHNTSVWILRFQLLWMERVDMLRVHEFFKAKLC